MGFLANFNIKYLEKYEIICVNNDSDSRVKLFTDSINFILELMKIKKNKYFYL